MRRNSESTLRDWIAEARGVGRVDLGQVTRDSGSPAQAADAAALAAGAIAIGPAWAEIDRSRARSLIHSMLTHDLAYNARCMADRAALAFADEVVGLIRDPTHYLTNIGNDEWLGVRDGVAIKAHSLTPVTKATFSAAVALVGQARAVVLIVSDED